MYSINNIACNYYNTKVLHASMIIIIFEQISHTPVCIYTITIIQAGYILMCIIHIPHAIQISKCGNQKMFRNSSLEIIYN